MRDGLDLAPGERIVFRSKRGGVAEYSGWVWLVVGFVGLHVCGAATALGVGLGSGTGGARVIVMPIVTIVATAALAVMWIRHKRDPAYFVTDRRIVARRFLQSPTVIEPGNVAGASKFMVSYTRYGRVVREVITDRVAVVFRSGGGCRFGPVEDADELVHLLQSLAQNLVDLRALPDVDGGLTRAEERTDLFLAQSAVTAGTPRGPVFVGPKRVIGFAEPLSRMRHLQVLTAVGAERSPEEIEQTLFDLSKDPEFTRARAVVMEREGATLLVEGQRLVLASGSSSVAFELSASDTERAQKFVKASSGHAYRS